MRPSSRRGAVRRATVLGANAFLLIFQVLMILRDRAADKRDWAHNFQARPVSLAQVAWMFPLALGIIFELTSFRTARIVNVSWYAFFGLYMNRGLHSRHLASGWPLGARALARRGRVHGSSIVGDRRCAQLALSHDEGGFAGGDRCDLAT